MSYSVIQISKKPPKFSVVGRANSGRLYTYARGLDAGASNATLHGVASGAKSRYDSAIDTYRSMLGQQLATIANARFSLPHEDFNDLKKKVINDITKPRDFSYPEQENAYESVLAEFGPAIRGEVSTKAARGRLSESLGIYHRKLKDEAGPAEGEEIAEEDLFGLGSSTFPGPAGQPKQAKPRGKPIGDNISKIPPGNQKYIPWGGPSYSSESQRALRKATWG